MKSNKWKSIKKDGRNVVTCDCEQCHKKIFDTLARVKSGARKSKLCKKCWGPRVRPNRRVPNKEVVKSKDTTSFICKPVTAKDVKQVIKPFKLKKVSHAI